MIAKRLLLAGCLAALVASTVSPAHATQEPSLPPMPENLGVPEGNRVFFVMHAIGTQNYICLPRTASPGLEWVLTGPQATLYDDELGQQLTHFASVNPAEGAVRPTWQHSRDSSAVWAFADRTSSDAAFVAPGAIPWLRLQVLHAQAGPAGGDRLLYTTYIQRVSTTGGSAPAGDCPRIGARILVAYGADYVFYRAR